MASSRARRALLAAGGIAAAALPSLLPAAAYAAPPARVAYTVAVADTAKGLYRVSVRAEGLSDPTVSFALPAWTPGWYVLTEAYKNVSNVSAAAPGAAKPLTVTPGGERAWRVSTGGARSVTFSYDLKAAPSDQHGFFEPYLDRGHGFVPGPASLAYVVGGTSAPCSVTYKVPEGWKVASANDPTDRPDTFTAPDYDTLADQPADLGSFRRYDKTIGGVPFSAVLVGADDDLNADAFLSAVWKISEAGMRLFGGAPFPRYVYHFRVGPAGGGFGLEHLNSTVIALPASAYRRAEASALTLPAHEFVHAWNVKRIRPAALGPFDYARPARVKDLWWLEGVTDYYAPRLVVEAGLRGPDFWYGYMSAQINGLQSNDARTRVSLEEASLKVWEGEDESEGYGGLSYYNKGLVVGLLLDIEMRKRSGNRAGLDDLMRALLAGLKERGGRGYADGEIERLASRLAGADLTPFFDRALRSRDELEFKESLAAAGIDAGERVTVLPLLGISWNLDKAGEDGYAVKELVEGGPAAKAGVKPGDVVTAVDGRASSELFGAFLQNREPGQSVVLTVRRGGPDGEYKQVPVTLGRREQRTYRLRPLEGATPEQAAILASLTGRGRNPAAAGAGAAE